MQSGILTVKDFASGEQVKVARGRTGESAGRIGQLPIRHVPLKFLAVRFRRDDVK